MSILKYPLEELVTIKKKRFEQALKILEEKTQVLEKEEKTLKEKEKQRDEVISHKKDKIQQLNDAFDKGTTSDKVKQKKIYLEVVEEKVIEKTRQATAQKEKVKQAEKEVEEARKNLFNKKKDVEKLEMHKELWAKEVKEIISKEEAVMHDELGVLRHAREKMEKKRKEK